MKSFSGKVAVVTGAGSGIGRALAYRLAREGASLALSDVNEVGLAETAAEATKLGAKVHTAKLDVADRAAMLAYSDTVLTEFGTVNLVINNAGISAVGNLVDIPWDRFDLVMNIDFGGVLNGTKAFLPHVIASGEGHIVNISSLFGLVAVPGQSPYNAAKFAVRGLTEALRQEMKIGKYPVGVTCVHPGGIKTNIAKNAVYDDSDHGADKMLEKFDKFLTMSPDKAAQIILNGVKKNAGRVIVGMDARAIDTAARVLGSDYYKVQSRIAGAFAPELKKKRGESAGKHGK